ncbi:hypothetical protein NUTIK01_13650 [Novosphingobium sp. IK01]|uniref:Uncharacterized protein n=1 Tax=Novosphingobium pituita TaxID=3056842 RepID=A0ABQ6P5Q2_9SPHN|nr:hypothetical protein NUTIK01_13650 [Novosphingobium sp. IK01]
MFTIAPFGQIGLPRIEMCIGTLRCAWRSTHARSRYDPSLWPFARARKAKHIRCGAIAGPRQAAFRRGLAACHPGVRCSGGRGRAGGGKGGVHGGQGLRKYP